MLIRQNYHLSKCVYHLKCTQGCRDKTSVGTNVRKTSGDILSVGQTSIGTKLSEGQTSIGTKRPEDQTSVGAKRLEGQNILMAYFQYTCLWRTSITILYWIAAKFISLYTCRKKNLFVTLNKKKKIRLLCWYLTYLLTWGYLLLGPRQAR
jgi:hypothetical protein